MQETRYIESRRRGRVKVSGPLSSSVTLNRRQLGSMFGCIWQPGPMMAGVTGVGGSSGSFRPQGGGAAGGGCTTKPCALTVLDVVLGQSSQKVAVLQPVHFPHSIMGCCVA